MLTEKEDTIQQGLLPVISKLILVIVVLVIGLIVMPVVFYYRKHPGKPKDKLTTSEVPVTRVEKDGGGYWTAPDIGRISDAKQKAQVEYGKELIAHTAKYLGPNGSVLKISNGLNCQNCHLQGGTAVYGNNYGSVASQYPKFRARSGTTENIYRRVNDCFESSLNCKEIYTSCTEMQAQDAYINFLGSNMEKGKKAEGSGLKDISFLDRPADSAKGLIVYTSKCQSCHQANGEGIFNKEKTEYIYPALWGENSYNDGAGLYRLSSLAKYVKYNMPQGITHENPQLSDEQAWDVAAYINAQPRPHMNVPNDWPDKTRKPFDHPFGPYDDSFSEKQHKLGPFKPIIEAQTARDAIAKTGTKNTRKK
jgi:thiosulfate dehydrogenase